MKVIAFADNGTVTIELSGGELLLWQSERVATKRDLAEAAVAAWDRGEISGDAAVLIIKKALLTPAAPAAPVCQQDHPTR